MFNRPKRPEPDVIEVILGPRSTFNGVLRSDTSIRIDGIVEAGLIETPANVIITESGQVFCDIQAKNVSIRGRFSGTLQAQRAELLSGSYVSGALHVDSILLDDGAVFDGELHMQGALGQEQPSGRLPRPDGPLPVIPGPGGDEEA